MDIHEFQQSLVNYYGDDFRISDIYVRPHVADEVYKHCYVVYYKFNGDGRNVFVDQRACDKSRLVEQAISQINCSIVSHDGKLLGYQLNNLTYGK